MPSAVSSADTMSKISLFATRSAICLLDDEAGRARAGHSLIFVGPCECTAERLSSVSGEGSTARVDATRRTRKGKGRRKRLTAWLRTRGLQLQRVTGTRASLAWRTDYSWSEVSALSKQTSNAACSCSRSLNRLARLLADKFRPRAVQPIADSLASVPSACPTASLRVEGGRVLQLAPTPSRPAQRRPTPPECTLATQDTPENALSE